MKSTHPFWQIRYRQPRVAGDQIMTAMVQARDAKTGRRGAEAWANAEMENRIQLLPLITPFCVANEGILENREEYDPGKVLAIPKGKEGEAGYLVSIDHMSAAQVQVMVKSGVLPLEAAYDLEVKGKARETLLRWLDKNRPVEQREKGKEAVA